MDIDGVDAEVLYVGGPLQTADAALHLDSVRGYNRWLSDYASHAPDRLLGVAAIPIDTPERAVEEIQLRGRAAGPRRAATSRCSRPRVTTAIRSGT